MSDLVELMALWENRTKAGKPYVSGYLGSATIVGFKNEDKRNEKEPDWKFYISKGKRQKEYEERRANGGDQQQEKDNRAPAGHDKYDDRSNQIPF